MAPWRLGPRSLAKMGPPLAYLSVRHRKIGETCAVSTQSSYKSEGGSDKAAPSVTGARPADFAAVEEFLHLLARAVRQFHTYPTTSPMCADAIAACHKL